MIQVLMSGQAGAYAVVAKPTVIYDLHGRAFEFAAGDDWSSFFKGTTDVRSLKFKSREEAHDACVELRSQDRALRFTLHLLEGDDEPLALIEAIERLFLNAKILNFVEASLYVDALPDIRSAELIQEYLSNSELLAGLVRQVLRDQDLIRKVRELLDQADYSEFEEQADINAFRCRVFQIGAQRDLVRLINEGKSVEFLLMQLNSTLRYISGSRRALETWTASLRTQRVRLIHYPITEEERFEEAERPGAHMRGRGVLEQIRSQQAAIERRLKERDIVSARKFASDLIRGQRSNSTSEQIAKSLSLLAQLAKKNGVPELQCEWAEQAVELNPHDLLTHSHLIDALIGQNRLHEASLVVDKAEAMHGGPFLRNARARLLRIRGDLEKARETYVACAVAYPHHPEYPRALAGAAETLRDMGRYDQALKEYSALVAEHPTEEAYWCGLASVYLDMGQFDKAIQNFGKALRGKDVIARCGRASAYRQAGQFEQALRIYEQLLREFPNDERVLCGRADVYKAGGDVQGALASYDLAIERNPFTSRAIRGKFDVLKDSGRLVEAKLLLEKAFPKFPDDPVLVSAHAELLEGQANWLQALSEYEAVIKNFPRSQNARLGRARVLLKLRRSAEALETYNAILLGQPYSVAATLGKAITLIDVGDFSSAEPLLHHPHTPKSIVDWRKHLLTGFLFQARGDYRRSKSIFEFGMRRTPFVRLKRMYSTAFARQKLRNGEPSLAVRAVDAVPHEISNVVRLHALAASGRIELANETWERIGRDDANFELAEEIARRFRIVDSQPRHDLAWIYQNEERALLLEAA